MSEKNVANDTLKDGKMSQLKPCPFCGGEAKIFKAVGLYWIGCMNNCTITTAQYTKDEVIEVWNRQGGRWQF